MGRPLGAGNEAACYFLSDGDVVEVEGLEGADDEPLALLASPLAAGVVAAELDEALLSVLAEPAFSLSAPVAPLRA